MSIVDAFKKTITFFNELKNEGIIDDYALIGGLALSAWIRPRSTKDIDLAVVVSKKIKWNNIASLIENRLLRKVSIQKGTRRTNVKEKLFFIFGQIEVDLISTKDFELADEAVKNALLIEVFDKHVKVVTPEYLILLKLLPLGNQDIIDIKALIKKTDMDKLIVLAKKHYLLPKLEGII